jgi:tubulin polyglutamylase TTLL2
MFFKIPPGPSLLRDVLLERGWTESDSHWNLQWKSRRYSLGEYLVHNFQRLNHFPNTLQLTRKDSLFRLLRKLAVIYPAAYNFHPLTFTLPNEFIKFLRYFNENPLLWICKPADKSRGRGIFVFRHLHELAYSQQAIVQAYIPNPLLIRGYKFDIRWLLDFM